MDFVEDFLDTTSATTKATLEIWVALLLGYSASAEPAPGSSGSLLRGLLTVTAVGLSPTSRRQLSGHTMRLAGRRRHLARSDPLSRSGDIRLARWTLFPSPGDGVTALAVLFRLRISPVVDHILRVTGHNGALCVDQRFQNCQHLRVDVCNASDRFAGRLPCQLESSVDESQSPARGRKTK